jgi:hypothetical protein
MKKALFFFSLVTLLVACSSDSVESKGTPNGFESITYDEINGKVVIMMRNVQTGCYYVFTSSMSTSGMAVAQMYVPDTMTGDPEPYCD